MARKPVKDKWVGARVDTALYDEVDKYIDAADMNMGDLVRKAVKEYMWAHPKNASVQPAEGDLAPDLKKLAGEE